MSDIVPERTQFHERCFAVVHWEWAIGKPENCPNAQDVRGLDRPSVKRGRRGLGVSDGKPRDLRIGFEGRHHQPLTPHNIGIGCRHQALEVRMYGERAQGVLQLHYLGSRRVHFLRQPAKELAKKILQLRHRRHDSGAAKLQAQEA